jgi:hypothetical protein
VLPLEALRQGACAEGFGTDHWILACVTAVIEQTTRRRYHPGHTWKLLPRQHDPHVGDGKQAFTDYFQRMAAGYQASVSSLSVHRL